MNLHDTLVVLDTCVQLRLRVADVLMDLRAEKMFSAHWTENIDSEFVDNMAVVHGIDASKAQARLLAMKRRCPEWEVFMSAADFAAVPKQVDEKDRHVAAAAISLRFAATRVQEEDEDAPAKEVILVTENIKDFAKRQMAALGVRVLRVGEFLDEVYAANPDAAVRAVQHAAKDLAKPPYTVEQLLEALANAHAKAFVAGVSKKLGLKVAPKRSKKAKA